MCLQHVISDTYGNGVAVMAETGQYKRTLILTQGKEPDDGRGETGR